MITSSTLAAVDRARSNVKTAGEDSTVSTLQHAAEDDALIRVNALGPLWVTHALMPLVRGGSSGAGSDDRGYGSIIFIGSVGGGSSAVFPEYRPADLMGKAAMTYLTKHLAAQHCRDVEVDVMCVSPGATETDMFRASTLSKMAPGDAAQFVDGMPKRRLIQPHDIARTVMWLASEPAARVFHGAVLDASMGLAVRPGLQTEADRL
jgi:NAD(P)-dependent dehydrogenase (short-subunit alcohol dehydrogenase family)